MQRWEAIALGAGLGMIFARMLPLTLRLREQWRSAAPLRLLYFPFLAKGLAPAIALELSGLRWIGRFPHETGEVDEKNFIRQWVQQIQPAWDELKPSLAFGTVPVLSVPGIGDISHELAILNYVGRLRPNLAGESAADYAMSQQLMCEAEGLCAPSTASNACARPERDCPAVAAFDSC